MSDFEEFMSNLDMHRGYSWKEVKDSLTDQQKDVLLGAYMVYEDVQLIGNDYFEIDDISPSIAKIVHEVEDNAINTALDRIVYCISGMLVAFADESSEE